jgi:hypothetical protein
MGALGQVSRDGRVGDRVTQPDLFGGAGLELELDR